MYNPVNNLGDFAKPGALSSHVRSPAKTDDQTYDADEQTYASESEPDFDSL